jgi:hypothetical protein
MSKIRLLAAAGLLAVTAACAPVQPTEPQAPRTVQLNVVLNGANEVPPTTSVASGTGTVTIDRVTKQMTWSVDYAGLSGPVQAAHFHGPGLPGTNADVLIPMTVSFPPMVGAVLINEAMEADLLAGKLYINLHTPAFPNGEIRGQVITMLPMK